MTGGYDEFGDAYAKHSETSPTNAYYDRPAILAMAGDVRDRDVLDVGCAAGFLSAELVRRGARVTAVDASTTMVELARRRAQDATVHHATLGEPLTMLADDSFDLVVASLVLHYLRDWSAALAELRRVLRPGGALVASVHHPEDWHFFGRPDYFATEKITDSWLIGGVPTEVVFYRRPLSATFAALRGAGFAVDELAEPMPVTELASIDPDWYASLRTKPRFLYLRAVPGE